MPYLLVLVLVALFLVFRRFRRTKPVVPFAKEEATLATAPAAAPVNNSSLEQIKEATQENPEKIAEMAPLC